MKPRVLVLPIAAVVIAGLCAYKLSRSDEPADPHRPVRVIQRAPLFELSDQRKPPQSIRLETFVGRHEIVLAFFDEKTGLSDPVLVWLRQHADKFRRADVKVFAISRGLPQTHRKMLKDALADGEPVPFQMLSDLDGKVHQQYGLLKLDAQKPETGVFLIDRAGNMPWNLSHPLPLDDPIQELEQKFGSE
jgi:peroxiredoxin